MVNSSQKQSIHVLVIPGTFPTAFNPTVGGFTFDQVIALSKVSELSVGVLYPALRPWTSFGSKSVGQIPDLPGVSVITETCWTFPKWWAAKNWIYQRSGKKLLEQYLERFGPPDIVHAHFSILAGLFAANVANSLRIPFVLTEHLSSIMSGQLTHWQLNAIRKAVGRANRVISVSTGLRERLRELTGVDSEVIPNLTDLTRFYPEHRSAEKTSFLSVGSLTPRKRMDWLIRGFHAAFEKDFDCELNIVGSGEDQQALQALIDSLGESTRIHLLGHRGRDEVAKLMRESDVFALASSHETFGVVLIEALASDIPVVAANVEGPRDIVRPCDGILFEPDNLESLVAALRSSIEKFSPRTGVYRSGVERRFGFSYISNRIVQVYKSLLSPLR